MHNIVAIVNSDGYKQDMGPGGSKKSEQILINLEPDTFRLVSNIAEEVDRPRGYIARALMIRGLQQYKRDGHLRDTDDQRLLVSDEAEIMPIPSEGKLNADQASTTKRPGRNRRTGK